MIRIICASMAAILLGTACQAAETVSYSYDAKGRLVKVARSGTVNNGQTVVYTYDKAGNRTRVVTAGVK